MFDFLIFYFYQVCVSLVCFLIYIYKGCQSWIQIDRWEILNGVFGLMVMNVFAEIRNVFECFWKCNIVVFQIWVKKLCNILIFWECIFQYSSPDKS